MPRRTSATPTPPSRPTPSGGSSKCRATTSSSPPARTSMAQSGARRRRRRQDAAGVYRHHLGRVPAPVGDAGSGHRPLPAHHQPPITPRWCRICSCAAKQNGYVYKGDYTGTILRLRRTCTSTTPSPAIPARIAAVPPRRSPKRIITSNCPHFRTGCWILYHEPAGFHPAGNPAQRSAGIRSSRV